MGLIDFSFRLFFVTKTRHLISFFHDAAEIPTKITFGFKYKALKKAYLVRFTELTALVLHEVLADGR